MSMCSHTAGVVISSDQLFLQVCSAQVRTLSKEFGGVPPFSIFFNEVAALKIETDTVHCSIEYAHTHAYCIYSPLEYLVFYFSHYFLEQLPLNHFTFLLSYHILPSIDDA